MMTTFFRNLIVIIGVISCLAGGASAKKDWSDNKCVEQLDETSEQFRLCQDVYKAKDKLTKALKRGPTRSKNKYQAELDSLLLDYAALGSGAVPGIEEICSDGDPCTVDVDDITGVCLSNPLPLDCDDGNVCTVDTCDPTDGCTYTPFLNCDDGNPCTIDTCDPVGGCTNTAHIDGTLFDDGNDETSGDKCTGGLCGGIGICGARQCGAEIEQELQVKCGCNANECFDNGDLGPFVRCANGSSWKIIAKADGTCSSGKGNCVMD